MVLVGHTIAAHNMPLHNNKPVSQSSRSEIFWWATGQSNLADRVDDCSIAQSAIENQTLEAFVVARQYVCQV